MFENLEFLKSNFSYLTIDKYRKDECLKISDFLLSKLSYLTIGENRKIGFLKVREKVSTIS